MAIAIPHSGQPLVFDTLPAVKVRYYTGDEQVYCYARCYRLGSTLHISLCAFERAPAATSHIGFAYDVGSGPQYLWLSPEGCGTGPITLPCTPQQAQRQANATGPAAERFAGQDEQGWYWGATLRLPGFEGAEHFTATVCKYATGTEAFGLSCAGDALAAESMQAFTFIPTL